MEPTVFLEETSDLWRMHVTGAWCVPTAALVLEVARKAARGPAVELVCAEVDRVDAAGLQVLFALHAALAAEGKTLRLVDPSSAMQAALELCGLDTQLNKGGV